MSPQPRRDRLGIMAEVANVAKEPVLKTQIMYRANLSFAQLNTYLALMTDLKLLKESKIGRKTTYERTRKCDKLLEHYKEILILLKKDQDSTEGGGGGSLAPYTFV